MFMLTNNKNTRFQIVFIVAITLIALLTLGMAKFSSASIDKSYDAIERIHVSRSFTLAPNLAAYDQIENIRAERSLNLAADSYKAVEQLRVARGLSADRSYDASNENAAREFQLGERYGQTPQEYTKEQAAREYWLGERYGQTP